MNEYILFDTGLRDRFLAFIAARGLAGVVRPDPIAGFVVALPDGLADDIEEAIEDEYATLMAKQVSLIEAAGEDSGRTLVRIAATLADGSSRVVQLPADYGRRLFEHFSVEEIQELVSAVVQSAMNPVEEPMCRRPSGASSAD